MNDYIIQIDSYDYEERLETGISLVFFYEYTDSKSRALKNVIEEIAEKYEDSIKVYAVDAEQSPDIFMHFGVEGTPCVVLIKDGSPIEQIEGANLPEIYEEIIEELLS